jgi:transposase
MTDMRKSVNGLAGIISRSLNLDPFSNGLFLFCGNKKDRLKALHWEKDGFVLLYKRLESGRFQWPRTPEEVKDITWQEFRWLMEGLSLEQPHALKEVKSRNF